MKENNVPKLTKYDIAQYPSYPYPNTQPERLYTIGKLFGMQPVDFKNCKVLELGCASGGNIIPMATMFKDSTFLGIDLSDVQVKQGQAQIEQLGLKNVKLETMSIADITSKLGKFDYIIAHGLLSWVPKNIQDKIFEVCSKNLTKNGIAYVSYNTLPGWNAIKSIREMMLFHTKDIADPLEKVRAARLLLKFISEANAGEKTPYAQNIDIEVEVLNQQDDLYLLHDHLEDENEPFYFHQVTEKAGSNDLQYLGDTGIGSMFLGNFADQTVEILSQAANDVVRLEQYMDFIRNRRFRSSLFCHKDVALNRKLEPQCLEDFYLISQISTSEDLSKIDLASRKEITIDFANGTKLQTTNPAVILAIKILGEQKGKPIATKELLNKVFDVIGASGNKEAAKQAILAQFLRLVLADAIGIHSFPGNFVTEISKKPKASDLSRYQAARNNWITNQRSERNNIDLFNRILIQYLDGENDFDTIISNMVQHVENDDLAVAVNGQKVSEKQQLQSIVSNLTKENIAKLAPCAVLVA